MSTQRFARSLAHTIVPNPKVWYPRARDYSGARKGMPPTSAWVAANLAVQRETSLIVKERNVRKYPRLTSLRAILRLYVCMSARAASYQLVTSSCRGVKVNSDNASRRRRIKAGGRRLREREPRSKRRWGPLWEHLYTTAVQFPHQLVLLRHEDNLKLFVSATRYYRDWGSRRPRPSLQHTVVIDEGVTTGAFACKGLKCGRYKFIQHLKETEVWQRFCLWERIDDQVFSPIVAYFCRQFPDFHGTNRFSTPVWIDFPGLCGSDATRFPRATPPRLAARARLRVEETGFKHCNGNGKNVVIYL
ncbi:hypothetical protein J6590_056345 [Homalodisca vitripennis]|nr:hypothetical protein J6590_056345 [Homalodisca vitripennis]